MREEMIGRAGLAERLYSRPGALPEPANGLRAVAGVVLYLYDAALYDPLLTPQGHRGSPNFVAGR